MPEGGQIKVLIVDDIPETCDYLSKLLHFERDIQVVGTAGSGTQGLAKSKELLPDIALIDINMPDMDGITATEKIISEIPGTQVIIMSVQGEQDYLRRAMLAGASDFLVKPFSGDELANSIRHVYARRPRAPREAAVAPTAEERERAPGRMVAVFSPKGGVGCTTLTVNLAVALKLEQPDRRVGVLDANLPFGDIGVLMSLPQDKTISELISRFDQIDADLLSDVMVTHSSGVKVLKAPLKPEQAELITSNHVKTILQLMRKSFDYVFVDTWSSLEERVLTVLDNSDRILLVVTPELHTMKNVLLFLAVADLLQYPQGKIVLVTNRADVRGGVPIPEITRSLRCEVAATIGNDPQAVINSINREVPLVQAEPGNIVSRDIRALLKQIMLGLGGGELEEVSREKKGLLGRLRKVS